VVLEAFGALAAPLEGGVGDVGLVVRVGGVIERRIGVRVAAQGRAFSGSPSGLEDGARRVGHRSSRRLPCGRVISQHRADSD
jgi:hypothetical protein